MIAQVIAVIIFLAMFVLIITEIWERHYVTLGCALLTLIFVFGIGMHSMSAVWETLNLHSFFTPQFWYSAEESAGVSAGINWETIVFVAGMMIMVEGMARVGFFRWLCMRLAKLVRYQVIPLFITFMVLAAFLSMFIDSITVILFLSTVTIELAQLLKFNPVPMILAEVFCANLGGSATMCGDPPNIIIGTSLGYSFVDFLSNTGVIAGVSLLVIVLYFYLVLHKDLQATPVTEEMIHAFPTPASAIVDKKGFIASCVIFLCAVVLLITHATTGLTVSTIGVFIAAVTLIAAGKHIGEVLKGVDYKTLLFFVGLFVVVGGLEQTGILNVMADFIGKISGGNFMLMIAIIILLSAVASAFVDNIPFAATMIPIINTLAATEGVPLDVLAWSLAMGTDVGGSATPIGASANVVGIATAAKEGYIIRWGKYCKVMAPATIIVVALSIISIYVRYL